MLLEIPDSLKHSSVITNNFKEIVKIIAECLGIVTTLWSIIYGSIKIYLYKKSKKDLRAYYTYDEIKNATKYFIRTNGQNIPPSNFDEPRETSSGAMKKDTIDFFINEAFWYKKDANKYYIILGDSGMGKTTFLINLYIRYKNKKWFKGYKIKLIPLSYLDSDKDIDAISDKDKNDTIILLDAFDEDIKAVENYKTRLDELIKKTHKFHKVVITCRTQFFPSDIQEPRETGLMKHGGNKGSQYFQKVYLSPFNDKDVNFYLRKKYHFWNRRSIKKAKKIIDKSPNLIVRPMLLSYIEYLVQSNREYKYTYEIYEEFIKRWIERECKMKRGTDEERQIFKDELYKFSKAIALFIYKNRKEKEALSISPENIKLFSDEYKINLDDLEMKSKSLLNRNAEGIYKFAHKSILEYFLALYIFENQTLEIEFDFTGMDQTKKFYYTMLFQLSITVPWDSWIKEANPAQYKHYRVLKKDSWFQILHILKKSATGSTFDRYFNIYFIREELDIDNTIDRLFYAESIYAVFLSYDNFTFFSSLKYLKMLFLKFCNIKRVENIIMGELEILDLSNNKLEVFEFVYLPNLTHLYLHNNMLTDVKALSKLPNLKELTIYNNPISSWDIATLRAELRYSNCNLIFLEPNEGGVNYEEIDELIDVGNIL